MYMTNYCKNSYFTHRSIPSGKFTSCCYKSDKSIGLTCRYLLRVSQNYDSKIQQQPKIAKCYDVVFQTLFRVIFPSAKL